MADPILVIDDDGTCMMGEYAGRPPGWIPPPLDPHIGEPIDPEGKCVLKGDRPCILFANWDYGEDWSGESVREMHPFTLIAGLYSDVKEISVDEFWQRVRELHPAK